ncbi:MAG: hypothetical protein RIA63_12300 [Cyclobacteriaceae bacterium]
MITKRASATMVNISKLLFGITILISLFSFAGFSSEVKPARETIQTEQLAQRRKNKKNIVTLSLSQKVTLSHFVYDQRDFIKWQTKSIILQLRQLEERLLNRLMLKAYLRKVLPQPGDDHPYFFTHG